MGQSNPPGKHQPHQEYNSERDMAAFWAALRPKREPTQQRWFLPLIFLLIAISIPWYRKPGEIGRIVLGLPVWVWVALLASALISLVTAIMSIYFWRDEEDDA